MRVCSKCKQERDDSMFVRDKRGPGGLGYWCRECRTRNAKVWRHDAGLTIRNAKPPRAADEQGRWPCSRCNERLPLDAYYILASGKSDAYCIDCKTSDRRCRTGRECECGEPLQKGEGCRACQRLDGKGKVEGAIISAFRALGYIATFDALLEETGLVERSVYRQLAILRANGRIRVVSEGEELVSLDHPGRRAQMSKRPPREAERSGERAIYVYQEPRR